MVWAFCDNCGRLAAYPVELFHAWVEDVVGWYDGDFCLPCLRGALEADEVLGLVVVDDNAARWLADKSGIACVSFPTDAA